jgi:hypothetical protein
MKFQKAFVPSVLCALIAALGLSCASMQSSKPSPGLDKWIVLFDGKSTEQLRGYNMDGFPSNSWIIDGDALKTMPGKAVDLISMDKYDNFELEVEWKVKPGGNSGIIYRVAETKDPSYSTGPEMQVLDDERHPDGKNPKTSAGALYALIAPSADKKMNPAGEWNKAKLVIKNNHVEHWLNGIKIVEYEWASPAVKELIKKSKFKDMPGFMTQSTGHIALQHHGEEAWFRNVRVRRL